MAFLFSADVWLSGKRMFIGIDFSHAPPLSMHDRQANKIPSIPSLVGVNSLTPREIGTFSVFTPYN
jgi:hypothetical protein